MWGSWLPPGGWLSSALACALSFYAYHFLEWALHSLAHSRRWGGELRRVHLAHHRLYSGEGLLRPAPYRGAGGERAFLPWVLAVWAVAARALAWAGCEPAAAAVFVVETGMLLVASDHLHGQFHVRGSWLEGWGWFERRRRLHFQHHRDPATNLSLGGICGVADRALGTYRPPDLGAAPGE